MEIDNKAIGLRIRKEGKNSNLLVKSLRESLAYRNTILDNWNGGKGR